MVRMDGVLPYLARLLAYLLAVIHIFTTTHAATLVYNFTNLPSETVKVMRGVWMQPSVIIWEQQILGDCEDGQYEDYNGTCTECLTFQSLCEKNITGQCCTDIHLECKEQTNIDGKVETCACSYDYVWENGACTRPLSSGVQFMTAAQIALGASLLIAVSALSALTCKMCSSRRRLQQLRRYDSDAVSLNSVQRFVLRRLRDRPPRYDESTNGMPDKPPAYNEIDSPAPLPTPSVPQVRPVVPLVPQTQTSTSETSENFVTNLHRLLRGYRRSSQAPPVYEQSSADVNTIRPPLASFPEPEISIIAIQVPNENLASTSNVSMQLSSDVDAHSTSDTDPTSDPRPTTSSEPIIITSPTTEEQVNTDEDVQEREDEESPCDSKQESSCDEETSRKEIVEEPGGIDNPAFTPDM